MTGTLAQLITLVAYGNHYLKDGFIAPNFNESNTTFKFCNQVDFRELQEDALQDRSAEIIIADQPLMWFKYLKDEGCLRLALYYQSSQKQSAMQDHKLAGMIGGGGTWLIEAIYGEYSNYWANRWEVTQPDDADRNIWTVNYGRTESHRTIIRQQIDQQEMKILLANTLTEIANFAFAQDLKNWGELFERAFNILDSDEPEGKYYHQHLIPVNNYPLLARQILFAAGASWVFGGMGSWNDLGFSTKELNETYEQLSALLYQNINNAIIAAINE